MSFDYVNLSGRPPGRFVRVASRLSRGIRTVQAQVEPYAAAWRADNLAALDDPRPLWVVLGDSMAQGIGASSYRGGWAGHLADHHPELTAGYRLINLSFYGARVPDVLERQLPAMRGLGTEPALITCVIGSNDLMSRTHRAGLPQSLDTLLGELPPGTIMGTQPGGHAPALDVNRRIDRAVVERGLVHAEFRDPRMRSWRGKLSPDHFHPNDRGYAAMAAIVAEAVTGRSPAGPRGVNPGP